MYCSATLIASSSADRCNVWEFLYDLDWKITESAALLSSFEPSVKIEIRVE